LAFYVEGLKSSADELAGFGEDLFAALFRESGLIETWSTLRAYSDGRPLHLTLEFGRQTEVIAALPFELLRDHLGYLFSRPEYALVRSFMGTPAMVYARPNRIPKLLFAWACPQGQRQFDPADHLARLNKLNGQGLQVEVLENVSLRRLGDRLASGDVEFLHILAHGYRDKQIAGLALCRRRATAAILFRASVWQRRYVGRKYAWFFSARVNPPLPVLGISRVLPSEFLLSRKPLLLPSWRPRPTCSSATARTWWSGFTRYWSTAARPALPWHALA
jgi:hypothetical protein